MPYEDFTGYTEVDPNSHIERTSSRVTVAGLIRNEVAYVYYDKGAGYFGNFKHKIDVRCTAYANEAEWNVWALANDLGAKIPLYNGNKPLFGVNVYKGATLTLRLFEYNRPDTLPNYYYANTFTMSLNTTYYLTIERSGTTLTCKIYSNSARTNLLATLTISGVQTTTFRYVYAAQSCGSDGVGTRAISGYCENLFIPGVIPVEVTEPLGLLDAVTPIRGLKQSVLEQLGMLDSVAAPGSLHKTVTDQLGMLDSAVASGTLHLTAMDTLGMLDSMVPRKILKQTVVEVLGMIDAVVAKGTLHKTVSDILGMLDSAIPVKIKPIVISEILGLKDLIESRRRKGKIGDLPDHTITGGA